MVAFQRLFLFSLVISIMNYLQNIFQSKNFKKYVVIAFFLCSALAWLVVKIYSSYYLSTDNAYVNANVVHIASRVTGQVIYVPVIDNQFVKKDALLFAIDPAPFRLAVNSAKAELDLTTAELDNADITEKRVSNLVKNNYMAKQERDNTVAHFKVASSKVEAAKANLAQAKLYLAYTSVSAPTDGWLAHFTLQSGDVVLANQPLFALISNKTFWVDANFKETEIAKIKIGQSATVIADMYPDHSFKGIVESISGGAGTAFSLLPPQNATGNWVKVTQRVPVRIRILNPDPKFPLRIGTTASVTVNLHSK